MLGVFQCVAIQGCGDALTPAAFIHAQIVDVNFRPGNGTGVAFMALDLAEAVAGDGVVFQGHEDGAILVCQDLQQLVFVVFLRTGGENVRPNIMVHLPHLLQQSNQGGDMGSVSKLNGHGAPPRESVFTYYNPACGDLQAYIPHGAHRLYH